MKLKTIKDFQTIKTRNTWKKNIWSYTQPSLTDKTDWSECYVTGFSIILGSHNSIKSKIYFWLHVLISKSFLSQCSIVLILAVTIIKLNELLYNFKMVCKLYVYVQYSTALQLQPAVICFEFTMAHPCVLLFTSWCLKNAESEKQPAAFRIHINL